MGQEPDRVHITYVVRPRRFFKGTSDGMEDPYDTFTSHIPEIDCQWGPIISEIVEKHLRLKNWEDAKKKAGIT